MKTRTWILILALVFAVLAGIVLWQQQGTPARQAEVLSDGKLLYVLDLAEDRTVRVDCGDGWNVICVREGKISVVESSCPDSDCIRCGERDRGAPIICLPNRLTIRFSTEDGYDGVTK